MGAHSTPRGEKSSMGQANGSPQSSKDYKPKHSRTEPKKGTGKPAGSDLPPRGKGLK